MSECLLITHWRFLMVVTKHGNTLNLKFKGKNKTKQGASLYPRSTVIYGKTGQITFEEGNHLIINKNKSIQNMKDYRTIDKNTVAIMEVVCQLWWIRTTILTNEQRFILKR